MDINNADAASIRQSLRLFATTGMEDSIVLYFPQPGRSQTMAERLAALGYRPRVIDDANDLASLPATVVLVAETSLLQDAALMERAHAIPVLILAGAERMPPAHYAFTALPISHDPSDAELQTALVAAAQLLARERRMQTLLQASPVAVIEIDGNGECVFANAQWIELSGLSHDHCRERRWMSAIHEEDREALCAEWRAAADRCERFSRELRLRRPDGEILWVYLQAQPLCGVQTSDAAIGSVATFTNITPIKLAEERLLETTQRFRLLFEYSPIGLALVRPDYRLAEINPAFCKMLGYAAEELVGKTFVEITHPDDRSLDLAYGEDLLSGRIPHYTLEKRYLHKDGHPIWINLIGTVVRDPLGKVLFGMGIVRDITERHAMLAALRESEEKFHALFASASVGLIVVSLDFDLMDVNDAFCRMLGYTREELCGKNFLDVTHPDDRAADRERTNDLRAGGESRHTVEKRYLRKDGQTIWASVTRVMVRDDSGKVRYGLGIIEDITERREAERLRFEHLEHQRDALVREVHHRIKNNLQGVISLIEQLKHKQPQAAAALEEAAAQVGTIAVVHGLQCNTLAAEVRPRQLVEAIVASIARLAGKPIDCRPGNDSPGWEWRLNARDTVSIALVINELLYNALKHAGPDARIEVAYGSESGAFVVRVFNQPAALPQGFDFAAGAGLGTGLALVTSLLPRQGARLSIRQRGNGVEATLHLSHPCASSLPLPAPLEKQ